MSDENPYRGTAEPPEEPEKGASPYQGGAGPAPFPAYPAGHPGGPPPRSDRWKIWLGIGLAIPALLATGLVTGTMGVVDDSGALSGIFLVAGLLAPVVMLFFATTRKVAIGLLIGYAAVFILAAGACIALLASLDNSYG